MVISAASFGQVSELNGIDWMVITSTDVVGHRLLCGRQENTVCAVSGR